MTTIITAQDLYDVVDTTWPAAATHAIGCFTLRDGQGGGKRVSAATLVHDLVVDDIAASDLPACAGFSPDLPPGTARTTLARSSR